LASVTPTGDTVLEDSTDVTSIDSATPRPFDSSVTPRPFDSSVTPVSPVDPGRFDASVTPRPLASSSGTPRLATDTFVAPQLAVESPLGDYEIEALIGEGGMGQVYSAVHPLIGKRAAIKVLRRRLCDDPLMLQRFIDEARVVNQIGHPNIVDIFAFGETNDGRCYYVMEWLNGESLRTRIARGPIEVREACRILRELARALEAAHDKGVIHRDLKPENVHLVEVRGEPARVKLLDFGLAKLTGGPPRLETTADGAVVGTPQYMAPEQARARLVDGRADIYALGCMAFELVSGKPPFVVSNYAGMVAIQAVERAPRLSTRAQVPHDLDDLVARMLSKEPDRRPSLAEVEAIVGRIEDGRTTQSIPPPPNEVLFPRMRRERLPATSSPRPIRIAPLPAVRSAPMRRDPLPVAQPRSGRTRLSSAMLAVITVVIAAVVSFWIARSYSSRKAIAPPAPVTESHEPVVTPATTTSQELAPASSQPPPTRRVPRRR
jgi:serine/threonine-protein kinase